MSTRSVTPSATDRSTTTGGHLAALIGTLCGQLIRIVVQQRQLGAFVGDECVGTGTPDSAGRAGDRYYWCVRVGFHGRVTSTLITRRERS